MAELFAGHPEWWKDNAGNTPAAAWDGVRYQFFVQDNLTYIGPTPQVGDTVSVYSVAWTEGGVQYLNVFSVRDAGYVFIISLPDDTSPNPSLNVVGTVTAAGAFSSVSVGEVGSGYFTSITLTPVKPASPGPGFMFATGDALSPSGGPGTLVTYLAPAFQAPLDKEASYVRAPWGAAVVFYGNSPVYTMPLPEDVGNVAYTNAAKQRFVWRSKKFIFPGQTTLAAAKVVHSCQGGGVQFRLYVDDCCVYDVAVRGCVAFRLPPNIRGLSVEIELAGCSQVTEVRVASSIRELMGDE